MKFFINFPKRQFGLILKDTVLSQTKRQEFGTKFALNVLMEAWLFSKNALLERKEAKNE
ncbi:MAG: hypothetical protein LBQ96_02200 [Fusobacteriaceae bacterium]|nr:hypothetical protein [Fusobacteriaceae bacterium]